MKKQRKKRRRRIRGAVILLLLLIIAYTLTLTTPMFNITSIWVEGNSKISNEEIIKASGITLGTNIWRIGKSKAEKAVEKIPYIETARIKRGIPKSIKIVVTESIVSAYLKMDRGYAAIDKNAKVLELMPEDFVPDKPLLRIPKITSANVGEIVKLENADIENVFFLCLEKFNEHDVINLISEIDIKAVSDISFKTKAGMLVKLGGDEIDYKLKYFKRILEELDENSGGVLDLTNTDKVPYRENIY